MWDTGKYMTHVFDEDGEWYVYDVSSNQVYEIDSAVAAVLQSKTADHAGMVAEMPKAFSRDEIDKALLGIQKVREETGIFREWDIKWSGRCPICSNPDNYKNRIQQLALETTSDCNMRCVYCVSTHSDKPRSHMSAALATRAVNYYLDHSGESTARAISLYGGEPLLNTDVIEAVIDAVKSRDLSGEIKINIVTNCTLVNDDIIDLIVENGLHLQISLDGPERIHDDNRVLASGAATHSTVIKNIKRLASSIPDFARRTLFEATIAPPYEIDEIDSYFQSLFNDLGIDGDPMVMANFARLSHVDGLYEEKYPNYHDTYVMEYRKAVKHYISYCVDGRHDELGPVYKAIFDRDIGAIYRRSGSPVPEEIGLNGCCAPGVRKLYVSVDGRFFPCERMAYDYIIGNVETGISHDLVDNLYKDLGDAVRERCLRCWAVRLCSLCFAHLEQETSNGGKLHVPESLCMAIRGKADDNLRLFLGLHRANPAALAFLKEMQFE